MNRSVVVAMCLVASVFGAGVSADERVGEYLKYFPANTNAVVVVHVQALRDSELIQQRGWVDDKTGALQIGAESLPRWLELVVRAAHVHPGQGHRDWSLSVAPWPAERPFSLLARVEGVRTQQIHGQTAYRSTRGAYFAQLDSQTIAAVSPADRQEIARMIQRVQNSADFDIPGFLQEASQGDDSDILLALDLEESLDPVLVREWLTASEVLKGNPTEILNILDLLQTIRGLKLTIDVSNQLTAELRIVFDGDVKPLAAKLQPLFSEYLQLAGAHLEDIDNAEVELEPHAVVLKMPEFSESGLQRSLTLILSPTPDHAATAAAAPEEGAAAAPNAAASRKYYQAIDEVLEDLEQKQEKARDYLKTATWHENYAKQIDQLPIAGVDPELVDYGSETSNRLRALAASLRGTPLEVNTLQNTVYFNVDYSSNRWAPWTSSGQVATNRRVQTNLAEVRQQQAQAVLAGSNDRQQVWNMILDSRNKIRARMLQVFDQDFGSGQ